MNTKLTDRDVKLDFLRVLAILACIMAHALMAEPGLSVPQLQFIIMFVPDTAAIFIMASGALILHREKSTSWRYIWHRIMTYMPEFIIFSTIYVFLDNAYGFGPEQYTTTKRLCYMLVAPTWGPGWFILALTGAYLVTPFMAAWVRNATKRQVEIAILIWLTGTIVPAIRPQIFIDVPASIFGAIFNYAGYMIIGYYFYQWPFAKRSTAFKFAFFFVTVSVGIVFGYFLGRSGVKWDYIAGLNSGLSLTIVMVSLIPYGLVLLMPSRWFTGRFAKILSSISILSLGIYCSHWLVIRYWCIPEEMNWITATLLTIAVAIPLAWILRKIRLILTRPSH